ncbi:MAG: hypothetical protein HS118_09800 [Bacteroidia bacterium]|nr:hypothetical protein [Bacteroidia bacterium]MCO5279377.1 hypothetical protein [Saprospiraceae bacterium]
MTTTEIRCPKCGSNQLTANKKGFSGAKAVGGAILTGGIGLLAGTLGSNKVKITCLACGKEFKPGEGRTVIIPAIQTATNTGDTSTTSALDTVDQRILELCQQQGKLQAVKFCKDAKGIDLKSAKDYVDRLAAANGISGKAGGCFVATACYGDYDAPEVLILRQFRDSRLLTNSFGKLFVAIYYATSPLFATIISKSDRLKKIVRQYFLQPIVTTLQRQNKN